MAQRGRTVSAALAIAVLALAAVGVWLLVFSRTAPTPDTPPVKVAGGADTEGAGSPGATPGTDPTVSHSPSATSHAGSVAVFLGDGAVQGLAAGESVPERWTTLVAEHEGWTEDNLARAGTGYLASPTDPASCAMATCPAVRDMVGTAIEADPALVVVSAGTADLELLPAERTKVRRAVAGTYRALASGLPGTRVIAMPPLWTGEGEPPAALVRLDRWVQAAANKYGAQYVRSATTWLTTSATTVVDGELTAAGHERVAELLGRWLARHS